MGMNNNDLTVLETAQEKQSIYSSIYRYNKNRISNKNTLSESSEETIEDIVETYIFEYEDFEVPSCKPFKSYMDARLITDYTSEQYLLKSEYILNENGIYTINGRYACALGSFYTNCIGTKFDIVMESGEIIPCILADTKSDEHTDKLAQYTISNDSVVEFVVDETTLIPQISNEWGNTGDVSTLGGIFEGEISLIRIYK